MTPVYGPVSATNANAIMHITRKPASDTPGGWKAARKYQVIQYWIPVTTKYMQDNVSVSSTKMPVPARIFNCSIALKSGDTS